MLSHNVDKVLLVNLLLKYYKINECLFFILTSVKCVLIILLLYSVVLRKPNTANNNGSFRNVFNLGTASPK